jgi:hypothetical protein
MIQELIYSKFEVFYSVKYISQLLKNLGFSYQKARFAVGGKDPDNQLKREEWLKRTWPEILEKARQKKHTFFLEMRFLFHNGAVSPIHGRLKVNSPQFVHQETGKDIKFLA